MAIYGINDLHHGALKQLPHKPMAAQRAAARVSEGSTRPSPYQVGKQAGQLTAIQKENNGDVSRAVEIVSSNAKSRFSAYLPPSPTGQEMNAHLEQTRAVPDKIYADNQVKPVPFGSGVMNAYESIGSGLQAPMAHLHQQYARMG